MPINSRDTGAANPVRLDLTAWRLADGRLLVTPHGAPAVIMDAPDFTPANFTNGHALETPAPRKALPAPRDAVVKTGRAAGAKAAKGPLTCESCRQEFPRNRGYPAKRCPDCREGKKEAPPKPARATAPMSTVTAPASGKPARVHMTVPHRCQECNTRTEEDPCHHCKAPWNPKARP